ncbi:MAG: hypothetical protein VX205_03145 [Pseudomonadota bacterium]|jgi:hypothetical protein|nr:hypothetical protein [Sphingobium naphthae]MEC7934461.1 hypothetical protein [Pseudomonadota bacterium]MEC8033973.1 hypothetical protein [Pseudomonadota bacterium]|tara:strand:- start:1035 stop:1454 length:420 start_codon:yes stop_codon:yes gene_type:complete
MSAEAETLLSDELRSVACRSGNEWGWQPEKIPLVIDEAERLSILNIGGQLQFLMPHATCECYWVEVDALRGEPEGLTWAERVSLSATVSRQKMAEIRRRYDFVEEGRKAFAAPFATYEATGGNVGDRMCFIWYLQAERP